MCNESIKKQPYENYLFNDCHLKSDITVPILNLMTTGRKQQPDTPDVPKTDGRPVQEWTEHITTIEDF